MDNTEEDRRRLKGSGTAIEPVTCRIGTVTARTGWSRSEIYRKLAAQELRAVKQGKTTLILWQSVLEALATLPPATFRAPKKAA